MKKRGLRAFCACIQRLLVTICLILLVNSEHPSIVHETKQEVQFQYGQK